MSLELPIAVSVTAPTVAAVPTAAVRVDALFLDLNQTRATVFLTRLRADGTVVRAEQWLVAYTYYQALITTSVAGSLAEVVLGALSQALTAIEADATLKSQLLASGELTITA